MASVKAQELDKYHAILEIDIDESVLDWWRINSNAFLSLCKIARKNLCIQNFFGRGGPILTDYRSVNRTARWRSDFSYQWTICTLVVGIDKTNNLSTLILLYKPLVM